ncbi:hypothetical protein ACW9H6_28865 [Pseudomonas sp. SDO528_S397]
MLKPKRPLLLPEQLKWKFSDDTTLLEWTIKARNYNTFVANTMFWCCFISLIIGSVLLYRSMGDDPFFSAVSTFVFFSIVTIALTSMTHEKMCFAYRISSSGVEYCKWKSFPKAVLLLLKWLVGITVLAFLFIATIDPSLILGALMGPGGIGLLYLSMAKSKKFRTCTANITTTPSSGRRSHNSPLRQTEKLLT